MQDEMYLEEKFADMSWEDIVTVIQGKKHISKGSPFDGEAWKTQIQYAQKVLGIFENSGSKNNNILFQEFTTVLNQFTTDLTQEEKILLHKSQELIFEISELDHKLQQSYSSEDSGDIDYELQQKEEDALRTSHEEASSALHKIFSENWKIQLIVHLQERSKLLSSKAQEVEDFKRYGMDDDYPVPEPIRMIMDNARHKILYSNFGIHFLVRGKDWKLNPYLGLSFEDTPFTLNKITKETRRTVEHEGRHNIFNALVHKKIPSLETLVKRIDESIQKITIMEARGAPKIIIGNGKKRLAELVVDMAESHINENKDEILANFEYLAKGIPSTDIHKYHQGKDLLQKLRREYERKGLPLDIINICIDLFSREMHSFYREMADYFFIAEHTGKLQEVRLLVYCIDLEEYKIIESYLKSELQDGPYNALSAIRRITDPLKIEGLLSGKKRQAVLSAEELLLREIFFNAGEARNDNGFERAFRPDKIRALRYYFEKYEEFDPEKRFQSNRYLKEFINLSLPKKISDVAGDIKGMSLDNTKKIQANLYLKNLLVVNKKGRQYLYGE